MTSGWRVWQKPIRDTRRVAGHDASSARLVLAARHDAGLSWGTRAASGLPSRIGVSLQESPCRRPAPGVGRPAEAITISDATPACRLEFVAQPLELRVDGANVPDIGEWVTRDGVGRMYTYSGHGDVAVWNADGSLRARIGRHGQGPGEFEAGLLRIHVTRDDSVWVFDRLQGRWTVFDSTFRYVRTVRYVGGSTLMSRSTFIGNGLFLDAEYPSGPAASFSVLRFGTDSAVVVRSFGPLTGDEQALRSDQKARLVSPVGDDLFVAGPPTAAGRGYELELWDIQGHLGAHAAPPSNVVSAWCRSRSGERKSRAG